MEESSPFKKWLKEWFDALVFAVTVATIVRWLILEAYVIPTSSMEKSMLVGDYLFVSKMHYGSRTPKTPLQIPLTHQTIPGTLIPSYLDWIELPFFRLPGFSSVKRNDPVVFNYPVEMQYPADLKTFYVKRCVAIPGDSLAIKDGNVIVNGSPGEIVGKHQTSFLLITDKTVSKRIFDQYDITDFYPINQGYVVHTSYETAEKLKALDFIYSIEPIKYGSNLVQDDVYPEDPSIKWTMDNFGSLYLPKEGDKIELTKSNIALYGTVIRDYEGNKKVVINENSISIDDKEITDYTFKQGYYFMMGDNRHNSLDSRYWGFVPADHIVGKPLFIFFSIGEGSLFEIPFRIRWNRILSIID
jgi:signal peptidase I